MSLSDRLQKLEPQPSSTECRTCYWLKQQSARDQRAFWEWIDDDRPRAQLQHECETDGLQVAPSSFRRHAASPTCRAATLHITKSKRRTS